MKGRLKPSDRETSAVAVPQGFLAERALDSASDSVAGPDDEAEQDDGENELQSSDHDNDSGFAFIVNGLNVQLIHGEKSVTFRHAFHRDRCVVPFPAVMNKATTGSSASAVCQAPRGLIAYSPGPRS